jgi:UDP-N-acetylmuramyl pentapeptide synthase
MLELGSEEMHYHRKLAKELKKADHVLLYGPRMQWLNEELALLKQEHLFLGMHRHFTQQEPLIAFLEKKFKAGDSLFVKGSRGMQMQHIS